MFSLRIVTTDHYMSSPLPGLDVQYSDLRGSEVRRVPVVRVFGSTPSGQKTCMHIHGVFPYLYVPYDGTVPLDRYLRQFAASLDKAINVAQGQGQSNQQHVYKIVLVSGMSIYGYHDKDQQFLKIYMYNPQLIRKAADLLLGGAVLNKPFQPHESHIPYTLQLFIDYNLYGMNLVNVAAVKFRKRLDNENEKQRKYRREPFLCSQGSDEGIGSDPKTPSNMSTLLSRTSSLTPAVKFWEYENIPSEMFVENSVERQSVCELEVDVVAADILNRLEVDANVGANPGLAALWEDERQRRRERGEPVDNIAPPDSQERVGIEESDSEQILRERLKQIIQDLQPFMDSQSDSEMETSQDDIVPSTQASQLELHLSQDDIGGSQDTITFNEEDAEEEAVIDEDSVRHVVAKSESFCAREPTLLKVASQDRSLVDILAALADDASIPLSQQAVVEAVALEEHDSMLAGTSRPRDIEMDKLEEEEILEMSQKIWDGDERDAEGVSADFNLEGMDDTWIESPRQIKANKDHVVEGDQSDSDADSDIIPQYDGPGDEKSTRREVKEMVTKRLGMRGPVYNMAQRDMGVMQDHSGQYGQYNPPMGNYGGYPMHQNSSMSMSQAHQRPYPMMSTQQNPSNWGSPMYPHQQTHATIQQPHRGAGMIHQPPGTMHHSPRHHSPGRMQHPSGPMQHSGGQMNHSQHVMCQIQTGGSNIPPSHGNVQMSHSTMNAYRDPNLPMYPGGDKAGFDHGGDMGLKDGNAYGHQLNQYGDKSVIPSISQSGFMPNYQNPVSYASKQIHMPFERLAHPSSQSNHPFAQHHHPGQATYQQRQTLSHHQGHPQQPTSIHQSFADPRQMQQQHGNQFQLAGPVESSFHAMKMPAVRQQSLGNQDAHNTKITSVMPVSQSQSSVLPVSQSQSSFSNLSPEHFIRQQPSGVGYSQGAQENSVMSQALTASHSPRSTNLSPGSDMSAKITKQAASYLLKRPQSKGLMSDIDPKQSHSPGNVQLSDVDLYNSFDPHLPSPGESKANQSPVMQGLFQGSPQTPSGSTYHLSKPVCQNQGSSSNFQSSSHISRATDLVRSTDSHGGSWGQTRIFSSNSPQQSNIVNETRDATNLFGHKKLCYEQISPPSTPSMEKSHSISKPLSSSPVASQPKMESQLSPLQKLLLEPATDRSGSKISTIQRSQSRNSVSSVSSVSSDRVNQNIPMKKTDSLQGDSKQCLSHVDSPAAKSGADTSNESKLYNLLSSDTEMKSRLEEKESLVGSRDKLNDSQQDLFSDSLLSPTMSSSGNPQESQTGNDSLTSLFNDSYDNELSQLCERGNTQHGLQSNFNLMLGHDNRSMNKDTGQVNKGDSLSTLESFVGSVTSDTDYGINFSKGCTLPQQTSLMTGASDQSFLSQLSSNDLSDLGSFTGQFAPFPDTQPIQHQNSSMFGLSSWPEHSQFTSKTSQKRLDGGPPRKRGRPPKNSLSSPVMPVVPAVTGEKKRRGRPRKNSLAIGAVQQSTTSTGQNVQMQFAQYQEMSGFGNVNSSQQFQKSPGQPQQQQLQHEQQPQQQFQSSQPFFHQHTQQPENSLSVQTSTESYNTGFDFMQSQSFQTINQPNTTFSQYPNTENQVQLQQYVSQEQQQQQQRYEHGFMSDSYLQQSQEFKHDNVSNQDSFLSQSSSIMSTIDASQLFHEEPQQVMNLDAIGEAINTQDETAKTSTEFTCQEQDFQLTTLQSMKHPNTLVQSNALHSMHGSYPQSEVWNIPLSRPSPSPAYNYKFHVPTPFCKKQKVSDSGRSSPVFVRMHPKDARKYSLLKIGREVIRLPRLSHEKIEQVRADIAVGVVVESLPPPAKNLHVESTCTNNSLIANLLTCDSPKQGDMIESALVDSAIKSSIQGKTSENLISVSVQESKSVSIQNDTKNINPSAHMKADLNIDSCSTPAIKRQRRTSVEGKERRRNMFRNKNIANLPHLKKYRAGFSYFGKGNVGRGGHMKVRQNHPVLGPEFEDDSNIVLKDVSLNDGVLTPIKSRTPVTGRSPAHSSGHCMSELEGHEKEELESKLKSLYDLDLQQSQNSNMFHEAEMFVGEDEESSEDGYESSENSSEEGDGGKELETKTDISEKDCAQKSTENDLENKENVCTTKTLQKKATNEVKNDSQMIKDTRDTCDKSVEASKSIGEVKEIVGTGQQDKKADVNDSKKYELCKRSSETESVQNLDTTLSLLGQKKETDSSHEMRDKTKTNCEIDLEENGMSVASSESTNSDQKVTFYGKFKTHFQEKFAQSNHCEKKDVDEMDRKLIVDNENHLQSNRHRHQGNRSRSSSSDSRELASNCDSRRSSAALSVESVLLSSESSSVNSCSRQLGNNESKIRLKKRKSKSLSSGSRKSSRSSSVDNDVKKKSKSGKLSKRKPYNVDSDSDGIPGVDYIVTGKFKGYKEMKVKVNKIDIDSDTEVVNIKNVIKPTDVEKNGFHCNYENHIVKDCFKFVKEPLSVKTGFSAEFEKFLASQSQKSPKAPVADYGTTLSDPTKCNEPNVCKMGGNEIEDLKESSQFMEETATHNEVKSEKMDSDKSTPGSEKENCSDKDANVNGMKDERNHSSTENSVGEFQFNSSSCSCVNACVCSVDVDSSVLSSAKVVKASSSSSEDDSKTKNIVQKNQVNISRKYTDARKKKKSSGRLANAFCSKKTRKRRPQRRRPSKWMSTLNALHDATMEKLTANKVYDIQYVQGHNTGKVEAEESTPKGNTLSALTPDFEVYCDRAVDYDDNYSDTLFRLAYYSPPSSDNGNNSSPQPLSPEEMKQVVTEGENSRPERLIEHREQKMTLADIMKSVRQADEDGNSSQSEGIETKQAEKDFYHTDKIETEPHIKTAVAKEAPLTLTDIKSYCVGEEKKPDLSSPPDLGPPVIPKYFSDQDCNDEQNLPPNLTPNRQFSSDSKSDSETPCINDLVPSYLHDSSDEQNRNLPPFLTPCRSPRISLSPRGSPRMIPVTEHKNENRSYFSLPADSDTDYKVKPGKSPGASSSTGSINVIHSEQFSDISEDEENDDDVSPVISIQNKNIINTGFGHDNETNNMDFEKERKLKEIREFENRHEKSDKNRNNIFDLLSSQNGSFMERKEPKDCSTKEQFVRNVELILNVKTDGNSDSYSGRPSHPTIKDQSFAKHGVSADIDLVLNHRKPYAHTDNSRRGLFDSIAMDRPLWNEDNNASVQNGLKTFNSSFELSSNPLNALMDLHKTHFSPNWQSHQISQSSKSSCDRSIKTNKDYCSIDLFDSSSDQSVKSLSQNSRYQIAYSRSLSESSKYDYSIVTNKKLNDLIIKSVANHSNVREQSKTNSKRRSVEDQDGGGGDNQSNNNSRVQSAQSTSSTSSTSENVSQCKQFTSVADTNQDKGESILASQQSDQKNRCNVITPLIPPPNRGNVQHSMPQLGLTAQQLTGPFYSNHRDVPNKPREGGGQVLKVPSALVKDLEDFQHLANTTGLKDWRTILCVNDNVFMSQSDSNLSVTEQLEKFPQLKYALTGDRSVVICPFDLPPSNKQVTKWCKGKTLYKDLRKQALQIEGNKDHGKLDEKGKDGVSNRISAKVKKSNVASSKEEEEKTKSTLKETVKGNKLRLNLFTGKREFFADEESNDSSKDENKSVKGNDHSIRASNESLLDSPSIDIDMESSLIDLPKINIEEGTPVPTSHAQAVTPVTGLHAKTKTPVTGSHAEVGSPVTSSQNAEDDGFLHSTPLLRKESTELFEPECTPIGEESKPMDVDGGHVDQFVTPKRIKSLQTRRSSSGSSKSLQQAFMNTQLKRQFITPQTAPGEVSQIEGPSLKNSFGFKLSQQNFQTAKTLHEHLTVLSVEVHAESRGDLRPDPEIDAIQAIFYSIFNDVPPEQGIRYETGVLIVDPTSANQTDSDKKSTNQNKDDQGTSAMAGPSSVAPTLKTMLQKSAVYDLKVTYFGQEQDMLRHFKQLITEWDPDILVGYEIQMLSWGYILQRASALSYNLTQDISRVPSFKQSSHHSAERDEWGADHHSEIHIAGRIVLNLWRILRHEVTLNIYSFENVAFHVLHRRIPLYSFKSLTSWFNHRTDLHRWKVIDHYVTRVKGILDIMDKLDLVGRTSEFARVFGIEFYHVLSRGSQYRVESMMLRVAKPLNYIPVSPSVHQRARMKAPECIPLTLEPQSRFYTDPVIVLDFQSLYPSIMIAYNYCFSTCLGRLEWFQNVQDGPIEFGCTSLNLTASIIKGLEKDVTISPNGVVFCKQSVKRGVLPLMVEEILNTRLMVKKAMSSYKDDRTLSRLLNARQLGLKLIANVTYGYTGANFSGRMPCIEVGDSIVRKARETLERSIKLVEETPKWGAKVIYGDTDSMFLQLKGCSKDEAFRIGQDIAQTVTKMFPKPIKLKFEKVYFPCVLQTKKRYCGFMYETPDQKDPVFDAKGIETVRRDSCSAVSKMLERSIKILFTSKDVSQVKSYVQQQCKKVMEGTVSLQDYIFAKEYRGIPGYKPGACVPALEISKKLLRHDRRSEPRVGERVPYVIVYGSPGLPLIQLVRQPLEVLQDHSLRLNSVYYITKQILPPLDRFLSLLGVDVFSWYHDMPHSAGRITTQFGPTSHNRKGTISQYFATSNCPLCDEMTKQPVCGKCMRDPQLVCITLNDKIQQWERVQSHLEQICKSCSGSPESLTGKACVSLDCPILHRKSRATADMDKVTAYRNILEKVFKTNT